MGNTRRVLVFRAARDRAREQRRERCQPGREWRVDAEHRGVGTGHRAHDAASLEATLKATAANLGVKVGALVHPTRLAVTGSNAGPSLYHLLEILGKEKVLARIERALVLF